METFVFVTNNQHKLEEAKAMLKNKINIVGLSGIGCYDNIPETGKTLKENALQKHILFTIITITIVLPTIQVWK